jgi:hypothetical protein
MRRMPAEFARVKVRFPQWYIQRSRPGAAVPGYTAVEVAAGRRIRCTSRRNWKTSWRTSAGKPETA